MNDKLIKEEVIARVMRGHCRDCAYIWDTKEASECKRCHSKDITVDLWRDIKQTFG